jgi:hypothetical protein
MDRRLGTAKGIATVELLSAGNFARISFKSLMPHVIHTSKFCDEVTW